MLRLDPPALRWTTLTAAAGAAGPTPRCGASVAAAGAAGNASLVAFGGLTGTGNRIRPSLAVFDRHFTSAAPFFHQRFTT